jgi:O-antigen/teichoic acid export membrane protein
MNLQRRILKGSALIIAGEMICYAASFLRNMVLARVLTKSDFGVAASFALAISALEFTGKMCIGQLVVQSKEGDEPEFLATAQLAQFLVALVSSACLFLAAGLLARLFGLPGSPGLFRVLCLVPLFKGLENLEVRRMVRQLRFMPSVMVEVVPQLLITVAVWPLSAWFKDYRLVLVLLIAKAAMTCLGAHWYAGWVYRWGWRRRYVEMIWRFGWPLVINGLLVVAILQGDRFFVAGFYSLSDLAVYSAAATLTLVPGMIFAQTMSSVALPVLAQVQDDGQEFRKRYRLAMQTASLFSVVYVCVAVVASEPLMVIVFGRKYAGGGILLAWFTVANAFRCLRVTPAIAALAKGDPKNQTISNVFRASSLLLAVWVACSGKPLWAVAAVGVAGEAVAFLASVGFLSRRLKVPPSDSLFPTGIVALAAATSGLSIVTGTPGGRVAPVVCVAFGLAAVFAVVSVFCLVEIRRELAGIWRRQIQRHSWFPNRGEPPLPAQSAGVPGDLAAEPRMASTKEDP